jgi:hypothetical protein
MRSLAVLVETEGDALRTQAALRCCTYARALRMRALTRVPKTVRAAQQTAWASAFEDRVADASVACTLPLNGTAALHLGPQQRIPGSYPVTQLPKAQSRPNPPH